LPSAVAATMDLPFFSAWVRFITLSLNGVFGFDIYIYSDVWWFSHDFHMLLIVYRCNGITKKKRYDWLQKYGNVNPGLLLRWLMIFLGYIPPSWPQVAKNIKKICYKHACKHTVLMGPYLAFHDSTIFNQWYQWVSVFW
jgi:hypothetical protein